MKSIWREKTLPEYTQLQEDIKTDVLIVGGGMAGLLCAYKLRENGIDCVVVEADRICNGATKNTTAKITSQHGFIYNKLIKEFGREKAQMYLAANEAAINEFRKLATLIDNPATKDINI